MGSESLLRAACEKAFSVARDSCEADPSIEPPEPMRSFLYVARLPRRAITVAQRALEGDEAFRGRVAAAVTPEEVGQAGYIWLHRPKGWEVEFDKLKQESEEVKQAVGASGSVSTRHSPAIPPPPGFEPGQFANEPGQTKNGDATPDTNGETEDDMGDVNAIEHELSSLRGLVDRLANERQPADTADEIDRAKGSPLMPSGNNSLKPQGDGNSQQIRAVLDEVVHDRDEARRKHSESLTHQLELEKELTKLRQGQNIVDAAQVESDGRLVEARKELARITANRDEAQRQRKATVEQMTGLNNEINRLRGEMKTSAATSTQLRAEIAEHVSEKKSTQGELDQAGVRAQRLVVTNEDLSRRLVENEQEVERLRVELDGFADLARRTETVQAEAEDLAVQLNTVEADLATSHSRINQLISEVNDAKSDRDGMGQQVATLQESLGEALTDLSESRVSRDAERISTQEYRAERDELKVELACLKEVDSEKSAKLDELLAEQSAHASLKQRSSELEERVVEIDVASAKLKTDLTRVVSERDKASEQLKSHTEEITTLRSDLARLNQETSTSTSELEKAESSLEEVRVERETLATQLAESEQRVAAADTQATKFQEQLEEALSNMGSIQTQIENQQTEIESWSSQLNLERERADEYKIAAETHEKALHAITNQFQEETSSELEAAKKQFDKASSDLTKAQKELESSNEELKESGGELSKAQEELRKTKAQLAEAKADLTKADAKVDKVATSAVAAAEHEDSSSSLSEEEVNVASAEAGATKDLEDIVSSDAKNDRDVNDTQKVPAADIESEPVISSNADPVDYSGLKIVENPSNKNLSDPDDKADSSTTNSEISDSSGVASLIRSDLDADEVADSSPVIESVEEPKSKSRRPPSVLDNGSDAETTNEAVEGGSDELDELSNLMSQKVTSFSSDKEEAVDNRDDVTFFGERSGEAEDAGIGRPPSVFSTSELAALQLDEDSDVTFQPPSDTPISAISPLKLPSDDDDASLVSNDRRKVEVPADLASRGGVEFARFVVESPEIVLLVDGDGVAKMGWSSRTVGEQREALVSWLADLTASTGASSDVVFDGRLGDDSALPASRVVSIRLSTPPTEPAAALNELVDAYPPQFPIAVVTDNAALKDAAQERGAVALSNAQLLDLFTPE